MPFFIGQMEVRVWDAAKFQPTMLFKVDVLCLSGTATSFSTVLRVPLGWQT